MFRKRLTWFWILLTGVAILLTIRLVEIQVVRAAEYEELATHLLTRPVRYLRAPRGRIMDRNGQVLMSDVPSSDISVHYAVLTGQSRTYLRTWARCLRRLGEYPDTMSTDEIAAQLRLEIADMWQRLAELTGHPVSEFIERGDRIRQQVERIRVAVRANTGVDQPVAEEYTLHPVIEDVEDEIALAVRMEMEHMPWLRVVPSSRRVVYNADAVVHLIGRLGAVSQQHLEQDPLRDEELRKLHPGDRRGITGIERVAEETLRGTRGRIVEGYDRQLIERTNPLAGADLSLTIDMRLQEHVLQVLGEAVEKGVTPAGGAAVVIDVESREVLALVSYPIYGYDSYHQDYNQLIRDARRLPTRFRAVNGLYPPGSTCKAITLVGAITEGVTNAHERIHCTGHLLPDKPTQFRCWIYNHYLTTHDAAQPEGQNGEDAIRNSCNIYFYTMGGRLGPQRLCEWFSRFGLGRLQGTGLIEESPGIVPTEQRIRRHYQPYDAWNYSIGQGEVTATPLQVANVAASIAAGYWAPVRLIHPDSETTSTPDHEQPFDEQALRVLRTGMWRVVNERGATANQARLARDNYVLCGKTGSAQAAPQPIAYRYTFEWPDGRREEVIDYLEQDALSQFEGERPRRVGKHTVERYPALEASEPLPSHAWFMGYTQTAGTPRGTAPHGRNYAIAVVIEYGGSGGRVAGPVAKEIIEWLLSEE
ncbi:MAG: penicillin-binding transpeptidase domain-containing protein [Planctomycetota bacterium]